MKGWIKSYWPHFACWALFISYELGTVFYSAGRLESPLIYLVFYVLNISYFYAHATLLRYVFDRPRPAYLKGLLSWMILFLFYSLLKKALDLSFSPQAYRTHWMDLNQLLPSILYRGIYFTILSTFYWAAGYISFYKRQAAEAERRELVAARGRAEIRNALLRQQINPHLLFNTLNFIYSDVYAGSPGAARSVLLLSDIIRFGLEAAGPDGKTDVEKEIGHIRQLLEINRSRFDHRLYLDFSAEGDMKGLRFIPLILLTLTENVFKHGNLKDPGAPALILIRAEGGRLLYSSRNLKKTASGSGRSSSTGLENSRLRLDFAYPDHYELLISENDSFFELTLSVTL